MTHVSSSALNRRGTACALAESDWRTSKRSSAGLLRQSGADITAANEAALRAALESAGVEFIDENGGGPGVRLRKPLKQKR
jgi:hypothetical protein